MTHVVLLFEGADVSALPHPEEEIGAAGILEAGQTVLQTTYMDETESIRTAFRGQHKADEASSYMTRLYVTVYVYALSFVRKNTF